MFQDEKYTHIFFGANNLVENGRPMIVGIMAQLSELVTWNLRIKGFSFFSQHLIFKQVGFDEVFSAQSMPCTLPFSRLTACTNLEQQSLPSLRDAFLLIVSHGGDFTFRQTV